MASPFKPASIPKRRPTAPVVLPLDDDEDAVPAKKRKHAHAASGPSPTEKKRKRELDRLVREEDEQREAEDARPKRRSKSRDLLAVNTSVTEVQSTPPADAEKVLRSRFGKKADAIIAMLDIGETDGAITTVQRTLLQTLVEVIPITEHAVRASNGRYGVYQFNQTISQIRELLNDLQATRDKGLLGQSIVDRCVRPAFLDIAGQLVLGLTNLNTAAAARMSPEDAREFRAQSEATKKQMADYLMAQYRAVSEAVVASLS